jgi:hypothetical protein
MIFFLIAFLLVPMTGLSDLKLTLKDRKPIDIIANLTSITGFASANDGTFYITDMSSRKIYHIDASLTKILNQAGGKGEGPGEFSGSGLNIAFIDGILYVITTDSFVHRFDKNLKYIGRNLTRATISSIVKNDTNSILAYSSNGMVVNEPNTLAFYVLNVFKPDFSSKLDVVKFPPVRSFPSAVYGVGFLAKLGASPVVAYMGLNIVDIYSANGRQLKSIELQQWNKKPGTMKLPIQADVLNRMKSLGFTKPDELPDGNIIAFMSGDGPYVVLLGGKYTPEPQKSVAIINNNHNITYTKLDRGAEQIFVRGNNLYALEKDTDDVYSIATYRLE